MFSFACITSETGSATFRFSLGDFFKMTPSTLPLVSRSGPPLLPGDAAADKRSHFQAPSYCSGVLD